MQKPEWEIGKDEFFRRLNLTERDFEARLSLLDIKTVTRIVPLRSLTHIESVVPLSQALLFEIISKIKTVDGKLPFKNSEVSLCRIDPRNLKIGQKFAYRENYQGLLETLPNILETSAVAGSFGDLGAYLFAGMDEEKKYAMAFYLPPMIEQHESNLVIMDGIHRNYLTKQMGSTIIAVIVKNVNVEFPCGRRNWQELTIIDLAQKPSDINERYFDLKKNLFRDLKFLGIDG